MKKEKNVQVNLKNKEDNNMSVKNIPYSNKALKKWSAFAIESNIASLTEVKVHPALNILSYSAKDRLKVKSNGYLSYPNAKKDVSELDSYKLTKRTLLDLVKQPGYEKFQKRFAWLYDNYTPENYELVWNELQDYNERRKEQMIQKQCIAEAEWLLEKQVQEISRLFYHTKETRDEFGKLHIVELPMPKWITELTENQRQYLLDRARVCYDNTPNYEVCELETRQICTVPERFVKDINKYGEETYYSPEELPKETITLQFKQRSKDKFNNEYKTMSAETATHNSLVGKVNIAVEKLRRLAEDATIRDTYICKRNAITALRETENLSYEEKMQQALAYVTEHRGEYPPEELVQIAMHLFDIPATKTVTAVDKSTGKEYCYMVTGGENIMEPITDMQGPDSPYGLNVEFRDFLEPIYEDEGL